MKAVVLEKRGKEGVRIGDFRDPERPAGNAVMRVRAAALNHVDLYMRDNGKGITHELPMVLGLDAAGEIVEADPASGLKPGMRVMAYPCDFCGECDYCLAGEQPFCRTIKILGEQRHGTYAQYLSMSYAPEPDLFIRTGGEQRVSNFLLWQLAYTELYFTDALWPDFGAGALDEAFASYRRRERRFGRTSEQLVQGQPATQAG